MLAEPLLQVAHAPLQGGEALLVLLQDRHQGRLRGRGDLVPQGGRDWRLKGQRHLLQQPGQRQQFEP